MALCILPRCRSRSRSRPGALIAVEGLPHSHLDAFWSYLKLQLNDRQDLVFKSLPEKDHPLTSLELASCPNDNLCYYFHLVMAYRASLSDSWTRLLAQGTTIIVNNYLLPLFLKCQVSPKDVHDLHLHGILKPHLSLTLDNPVWPNYFKETPNAIQQALKSNSELCYLNKPGVIMDMTEPIQTVFQSAKMAILNQMDAHDVLIKY